MTDLSEKDLKKLYYSIGEVSTLFNVNASLIRFWEKEFAFNISKKNKKGNRLFSVKDILHFNKIYQLVKEQGYTLDGAKKVLSEPQEIETPSHFDKLSLISNLEEIKAKLLRLKESK